MSTNLNDKLHNHSISYYEVFILSLCIVWLPSKLLAYLTPFACMAWFIIRARSGKSLIRFGATVFSFLSLVGIYGIVYHFLNEKFVIQNAMLTFITFGSFLFFLILPQSDQLIKIDYTKYIKVIEWFILIEASLGIFQIMAYVALNGGNFDSAAGDVVQGTLSPLSFINPAGNFNNQIYSANLLLLLLFHVPYAITQKKGKWISISGFMAVILASVMHLFIAFIAAIAIISLFFSSSVIKVNTSKLLIALFFVIVILGAILIQPKNFGLIAYYIENLASKESPKTMATIKAIKELPDRYAWSPFIGLGPGQYSSRAGLIGTGKYFGDFNKPKEVPLIVPDYSNAFKDLVFEDWKEVATNVGKYGNSTMSRPFYSALTLLTEFGYVAFAVVLFFIFKFIRKLRTSYTVAQEKQNKLNTFYALACASAIVFFIFISFFENYLEVTQAIFPGFLLLKFFSARLKYNAAVSA